VAEAEYGTGVVLDAHQRRADQPFDRPFVPLAGRGKGLDSKSERHMSLGGLPEMP
jgi:hypothetical protein